MRATTNTALGDLPVGAGWQFGGIAYGLEPLVLPVVGELDAPEGPAGGLPVEGYLEVCWRLRALADGGGPASEVPRCDAPDELSWFRWITGHQVCFVLWRLMATLLEDVREGRRSTDEIQQSVSRYVHGYSAMLLYTGSCPIGVYNTVIRPSMRLRHRGFSGSWAPDYWPVRGLFRGRQARTAWYSDRSDLAVALRLHKVVHDGVAAKLVSDGPSLLQQASVRGVDIRLVSMLYDSYFATVRAPATRQETVAQLLRRLTAIAQDLAVNGLHAHDQRDHRPAALCTPEVTGHEDRLGHILVDVARCACEHAADVTGPRHPALQAPQTR
ncbi:hypothetical protein CA850_23145 [Micromonospora echinospora]|uniref:L-tyrosine 3-hydroxylase n=1 Tax=Micromonospora echinospora TaxID=1877 RepID=A0A1C4YRJ9_MICEC|nr:hypothetical protein [Micromonospora echinospora]OZV77356.1 hypothetical protein CA850_23145 [Micromonospora echinospora]SCF23412.1 hypothetical protein GA0070618_4291 [Micromonospora echinospora]